MAGLTLSLVVAFGWAMVPKVYAVAMLVTALAFWFLTYTEPGHAGEGKVTMREQLRALKDPNVWKLCQYYSIVFGGYVALSLCPVSSGNQPQRIPLTGTVTACTWGPGRLDVFARAGRKPLPRLLGRDFGPPVTESFLARQGSRRGGWSPIAVSIATASCG